MGWFSKNKKEEKKPSKSDEVPKLPELPKLPEFPRTDKDSEFNEPLPKLPSLPTNSLGEKSSQNAIKDAVKGLPKLEDYDQLSDEEEGDKELGEKFKTLPTLKRSLTKEVPKQFKQSHSHIKKAEPVFIRLDKFEESMKTIEKTKQELKEIQDMLADTKKIKEEEEKELQHWETAVQNIKKEIEKIDSEIFSKID